MCTVAGDPPINYTWVLRAEVLVRELRYNVWHSSNFDFINFNSTLPDSTQCAFYSKSKQCMTPYCL